MKYKFVIFFVLGFGITNASADRLTSKGCRKNCSADKIELAMLSDKATAKGEIDKAATVRVVKANIDQLKGCFGEGFNGKVLKGDLTFEWTINDQGKAIEARVKKSNLDAPLATTCALTDIRGWQYPSAPADQVAVIELSFSITPK